MTNPYIYIVLNNKLKMSPGKAAAQAVQAVAQLDYHNGLSDFSNEVKRTVIVLAANDARQICNLEDYLFRLGLPCEVYVDEGVNEVDAYSITALAAGPFEADDEQSRELFSGFKRYEGHVTVKKTDGPMILLDEVTIPNNLDLEDHRAFKALKKAIE